MKPVSVERCRCRLSAARRRTPPDSVRIPVASLAAASHQSRIDGLAVVQRFTGFWHVVVIPEPERLQLFLFGTQLIQGVSFQQFAVLHYPMNGVRIVDILQRA